MYDGHSVGVVVPAYNEETTVGAVIDAIPSFVDRIFVVDDCSTDDTWAVVQSFVAEEPPRALADGGTVDGGRVVPIRHEENRGAGSALKTGYRRADAADLDLVVTLDADGQMDPAIMDRFLEPLVDRDRAFAKGDRLASADHRAAMPPVRLAGNWALTYLTRVASGYWGLRDPQNGYTAITGDALSAIDLDALPDHHDYCNAMFTQLQLTDVDVIDVPMRAVYGDEESTIQFPSFVARTSKTLARSYCQRLRRQYVSTDDGTTGVADGKHVSDGGRRRDGTATDGGRDGGERQTIVVTIQHAGHVHFFKHAIATLRERGHEVHVFARENELSTTLLESCGIEYELLAEDSNSLFSLARQQLAYETRLLGRAREIEPDVMTAVGGVAVSHVATLVGAESVVFYDTEHASIITNLAYPFADVVCTPSCYRDEIGDKHVTYPGYHELAYLHPDRFEPDPTGLDVVERSSGDQLVVLRVGDWNSSHDVGHSGFDGVEEVVERLEAVGADLVVTAEGDVPAALEPYQASIPPERLHDLLWYADLYVGEGATTAAECAMLGTPAVYVNSLSLGYLTELDEEYDLVEACDGEDRHELAIETATRLLAADDLAETWERRREEMLTDKVDTTDVVLRELDAAMQVVP